MKRILCIEAVVGDRFCDFVAKRHLKKGIFIELTIETGGNQVIRRKSHIFFRKCAADLILILNLKAEIFIFSGISHLDRRNMVWNGF